MRRQPVSRLLGFAAVALALLILGGCAAPLRSPAGGAASGAASGTESPQRPAPGSDGPDANPPQNLAGVPDAEPRIEPIRAGGANKPYEALGQSYVPVTQDVPFRQRGLASWYGRKFHGRRTASGEPYDMYAMTAAHPTLPIPSYVRVRNPANGAEVVLRINDRGPFHSGRIVDLSYTAALKLGVLRGVAPVELERITFDDIRTGAWRRPGTDAPVLAAAMPPALVAVAPAAASAESPPPPPDPVVLAAVTAAAAPAPAATSAPLAAMASPASAPATATPVTGFWVQLGAFQQRTGAEGFHRRVAADVDWLAPLLAVFSDAPWYRLQAGPYTSRDEAQSVAQRVRDALKLVPVVLERR